MSEKRKYGKRKESLPMNYGNEMPPQDIELEEIVLGTIIIAGEILDKVISQFNVNLFFKEQNKKVAEAIIDI